MDINKFDEEPGTKVIFSKNIAIQLRERGFSILRTNINRNYPQYDCYVFKDTPEFREAFSEIVDLKEQEDECINY